MTVDLIIVKGADTCGTQPKCLSCEIQALANGAGFKMHIAVTTVSIGGSRTMEITNHREGQAGVTGESLSEAQSSGDQALVSTLHLLQLGTLRPEFVDPQLQSIDAVSIQIQLNETGAREVS